MDLGRPSIFEWVRQSPEDPSDDFVPAGEKYVVEASIGSGGMGEVFLVNDLDLRRQVAMKMVRGKGAVGRDQRLHFIAEAQATSQLEHPGIPPVHDLGITPDGRLYFTMKLVQGRTLREVLHDLLIKRREVHRDYTLHRLITILERICEPLHFSHEKGVIHRDLKPENVMLGDYGEVHVMDWGLARLDEPSSELSEIGGVETARQDAGVETQYGTLKGTLPYMSPEQARGEQLDRRSDVYALGCLLYEMLTLRPAFESGTPDILFKKQQGDFPDIAKATSRRQVPQALADICRKAMATDPDERYATADEFGGALRRWLDGRAERERRHREAELLAGRGLQAAERHASLLRGVVEAEAAAEEEAGRYRPYQPVREKLPLIEARRRIDTLRTEVALAFGETTHLLNAALIQEADNATARKALADLWRSVLDEAERSGDRAGAARALTMLERYASRPVTGEGSLALRSSPPGAEVRLYRYEEVDGVLQAVDMGPRGPTPVDPVALPMGSYLCVLSKPGYRDTRYPVHVTRASTWNGEVTLRRDAELGEGFVYVPGGPFTFGEGKEKRTEMLPDFAIARYPVTFAEYARFLDALPDEEAAARCPHDRTRAYMTRGDDGRWQPAADLLDEEAHALYVERHGEDYRLRMPVFAVSWHDAVAYCEWMTGSTGVRWRLPTEVEREKAARGVDGRRFAWGDLADASLGKCSESRPESARPEPVGAFPTAESVYGMGDASGGMWDWTDSWMDARCAWRVPRGGGWGNDVDGIRCAGRTGIQPENRNSSIGFRCARDLPAPRG